MPFSRLLLFCGFLAFPSVCLVSAAAQSSATLIDAPAPQSTSSANSQAAATGQAAAPQASPADQTASGPAAGTADVSGTVLDTNGNVIQSARVQLMQAGSEVALKEMNSGATGNFEFSGLQPGKYVVKVSGEGMTPFVSKELDARADLPLIVPKVILSVEAATTSVTVVDKEEASIQQVQIAEQQRVLKVFPNFYSSFDWNAPPILAKQKYRLAARTLIDPVSFLTTGAIAAAEQYKNVFPTFGGGWEGYGKRYGAAYASHGSAELFTRAIYPSIFHTDPRYFILGKGTTRARVIHALSSTFVTRGDDGSRKINFPQILGGLSAAALSNAYFPEQERGVHLVLINGLGDIGGNMMDNLIREFVLNHWTTRAKR